MDGQEWRDWRVEHSGLTWRVAEKSDSSAIESMLLASDKRMGEQDRPDLFDSPVLITLVAEDGSGAIVDGLYIELVADITKLTANRAGFDAWPHLMPPITGLLKARKIRLAQMFVIERWSKVMGKHLKAMGFSPTAARFASWVRRVVPR
jgi:hypothetical protein